MMEARRRALGRGLGALIPGARSAPAGEPAEAETSLPLELITPNPYQPRERFSDESIDELAQSIREQGLLQPLLVRRSGERYQLIAGERRFRAAQRAGLRRVPVQVRDADDRQALELALVENLQREDLNPIDEARAYQRLAEEFSLTQEEIAGRVAKNRSTVANSLRLLQLPAEVLSQVADGTLSPGHARSILAAGAHQAQLELAREIIARKLSVRDSEQLARKRSSAPAQSPPDVHRKQVEQELSRRLGTKVRLLARRDGGGKIEIEYYSLAELNGLLERLMETKGDHSAF